MPASPLDDPTRYRKVTLKGTTHWIPIKRDAAARVGGAGVRAEQSSTYGWRVWYTRPSEPRLTLYSAVYGAPNQGLQRRDCATQSRVLRAVCTVHGHEPPAPGCACGIYAVGNVVDALYRLRAMAANIRRPDARHSWFPYRPDSGMVPVLARVRLQRAVEHDDNGTWAVLAEARRVICTPTPVLRAASAEITRLFVPGDLLDDRSGAELAARLAHAFGVEAATGLPVYSREEALATPEWMRAEPWFTSYAVDAMMTGLRPVRATPLHVVFVCQGNICRSPMVEKMFTRRLRERGLDGVVRCSSAGWDAARHAGAPADERTRRVLARHGYPTAHAATQLADDHLGADLVVALDRTDARKLTAAGVPAARLRLLRSFDPDSTSRDVANPYHGAPSDFDRTYAVIATALPGLLGWADDQLTGLSASIVRAQMAASSSPVKYRE